MEKEFVISSIKDLDKIAIALLDFAENRKVFTFYGEIGAGKTTFIKAICKALNIKDNVNSPTYALVNEYTDDSNTVYHLDLYRLKDTEEALNIGIEEYLYSNDYCFIEWAEIIDNLLPLENVKVYIETLINGDRKIILKLSNN